MAEVIVYTKETCPHCVGAKQLLQEKGQSYREIDAEQPGVFEQIFAVTNHKTVPQIFIDNDFIGGFSELKTLEGNGELDTRLGLVQSSLQWD